MSPFVARRGTSSGTVLRPAPTLMPLLLMRPSSHLLLPLRLHLLRPTPLFSANENDPLAADGAAPSLYPADGATASSPVVVSADDNTKSAGVNTTVTHPVSFSENSPAPAPPADAIKSTAAPPSSAPGMHPADVAAVSPDAAAAANVVVVVADVNDSPCTDHADDAAASSTNVAAAAAVATVPVAATTATPAQTPHLRSPLPPRRR